MLATLQFIIKYVLTLGTIIGLVFMVACTVFVIVSAIKGDISVNIIRDSEEKEVE